MKIPFSADLVPGVGVFFTLEAHTPEFQKISGVSYRLIVTEKSFEKFKSKVLDKDVEWKDLVQIIDVPDGIPGTWQSNKSKVKSYEGGKPKRNRPSSRRRPTKRRRSRRNVNRKTKKN
jgi:hypothetical protein